MGTKQALDKVKVIDLSDERGIYGVKLLADHGADTVRPESTKGDPLRQRGPFDAETKQSLWYLYYASSRSHYHVNTQSTESVNQLNQLVAKADICFLGVENDLSHLIKLEEARELNPSLVIVNTSPFGKEGPWADFKQPEIVAGALGGSAAVTGDVDTPPLKLFGELNFAISGAYTAIAALSALYHAKETGEGQTVEVPVHECIASSLEHVFMWYFYQQQSPNSRAAALERRGSLHWTNLYEVMKTKNGAMMVTPTPNLEAQLMWLVEEDAFQDLFDPKFEDAENRRPYYDRFMQVIREWVAEQDTEELFFKAQDRHSPYGWVQNIEQVTENPQLAAREWWQSAEIAKRTIKAPGLAYQFTETPGQFKSSTWLNKESEEVLQDLGWEATE